MVDQENGAPATQSEGSTGTLQAPAVNDVPKPATPSNARTCGVCSVNPAKYKCTLCELPYCSIACNKEHKANHPVMPEPPKPISKEVDMVIPDASQPIPRAGTMAAAGRPDVLQPLLSSSDLQQLFTRYPSLRGKLREIYEASQPPKEGGGGGRFHQGRDRSFWTKEQGTRDGVEALDDGKKAFGKDGEGVREFAALVVKLISPENAINGNLDQPTVIERQTQDENAKMITQLLNGDLGNS